MYLSSPAYNLIDSVLLLFPSTINEASLVVKKRSLVEILLLSAKKFKENKEESTVNKYRGSES